MTDGRSRHMLAASTAAKERIARGYAMLGRVTMFVAARPSSPTAYDCTP
jgi:hypothetical protein